MSEAEDLREMIVLQAQATVVLAETVKALVDAPAGVNPQPVVHSGESERFIKAITGSDDTSRPVTINDMENGTTAQIFASLPQEKQAEVRRKLWGAIRREIVEQGRVDEDTVKRVNDYLARVNEAHDIALKVGEAVVEDPDPNYGYIGIMDLAASQAYVLSVCLSAGDEESQNEPKGEVL